MTFCITINHWKSDPDTYRYIQFDIILKGKSRTLLNVIFDETVCTLDISGISQK